MKTNPLYRLDEDDLSYALKLVMSSQSVTPQTLLLKKMERNLDLIEPKYRPFLIALIEIYKKL